jgi:hypothetical protein
MALTQSRFTILSQTCQALLRLMAGPTHTTLQQFTQGESVQIELDADELHAFLCALPPALLREALGLVLPVNPLGPLWRCENCHDPDKPAWKVILLTCGHRLCEFCAKDGCMRCAERDAANPFLALDDPPAPRCAQCGQPEAAHFAYWPHDGVAFRTCEPGVRTLRYTPPPTPDTPDSTDWQEFDACQHCGQMKMEHFQSRTAHGVRLTCYATGTSAEYAPTGTNGTPPCEER